MKKVTLSILMLSFALSFSQEFTLGATFSTATCNNQLYVSGFDYQQGALGLGGVQNTTNYTILGSIFPSPIQEVVSNDYTTFIILQNGDLWGFGNNSTGGLGIGNLSDQSTPVQVRGVNGVGFLADIVKVDTSDGGGKTLAIDNSGRLYQWGNYTVFPEIVLNPSTLQPFSNMIDIAAGGNSSTALDSNGNVWSWGANFGGSLGLGSTAYYISPNPIMIPNFGGIIKIDTGSDYTIALRNDGTVWSWGSNLGGSLGDGTTISRGSPVQVLGPNAIGFFQNATDIVTNTFHTFIIRNDQTLWSFGFNSANILGNINALNTQTSPIQVQGIGGNGFIQGVQSVATGNDTAIAKLGECVFVGWGDTSNNILGIGFLNNSQVPELMDVTALSCCSILSEPYGNISDFQVSVSTICPEECVNFEAIVGSGQPSVQWIFPGSINYNIQPTGLQVNNVCYDTPGTYSVLAYINNSSVPINTGLNITVLPMGHRACQYNGNDGDGYNSERSYKDFKTTSQFKVVPNPSEGIFNLIISEEYADDYTSFILEDFFGKKISEGIIKSNSLKLNLITKRKGVYFLRLYSSKHQQVLKLIKN